MEAANLNTRTNRKLAISPAAIVIALVVIAGVAVFTWLTLAPGPAAPPKPTLTAAARAYLPYLKLSDIEPRTSESYIQKSLFEIIGKITNNGERPIAGIQVNCVFRTFSKQEIKRELVSIADARDGTLAPRATKSFRLAFDDIPDNWDHQMPDFVISQISFQ